MYDLLHGLRIIDLSTVVLGPYATQLLADLGADVVKVEPVGGDIFRAARPGKPGGDGAGFLNINRNKRSIMLDLTVDAERTIFDDLIMSADVFVHNMREASAAKLGIDDGAIRRLNSDIIYCSARGFGKGPLGDQPAYDDCIQAASGLAWLNADQHGQPQFVRTIMCDKVAGLHLALAIAAGVAARAAGRENVCIEVPMFEAMASFLLVEQLSGQSFVPRLPDRGYGRLNSPWRRPYPTKDSYVTIMPYTKPQWQRFLALIGRDELADLPMVTDAKQRSASIDQLYQIVEQAAPNRTSAEWLNVLRTADIPCAPVNRLEELVDEEHLKATGFFDVMQHPVEGELLYAKSPFRLADYPEHRDRPAPVLDHDRDEILRELYAEKAADDILERNHDSQN
jgi:crotonobetainyl-CoA:carnitine CoA-transferase CaiB-like acyl-CoA transferase